MALGIIETIQEDVTALKNNDATEILEVTAQREILQTHTAQIEQLAKDLGVLPAFEAQLKALDEYVKALVIPAPLKFPTPCMINIMDLGCKPRDVNFKDNHNILNTALLGMKNYWRNAYKPELGPSYPTQLYVGDTYYLYDSIDIPPTTSIRITGNGTTFPLNNNAFYSGQAGPVSRFTWQGDEGKPMIHLRALGCHLEGLHLQGVDRPSTPTNYVGRPATYGILIDGGISNNIEVPTGKHTFDALGFELIETAIKVQSAPYNNHGDNMMWGFLDFHYCLNNFVCDNPQAVSHTFMFIHDNYFVKWPEWAGRPHYIFDIVQGGDVQAYGVKVNGPATVLRTGTAVASNSGRFLFNNVKFDNNSLGSNLLEILGTGSAINFRAGMSFGKRYTQENTEPILKIAPSSIAHKINIDIMNMPKGFVVPDWITTYPIA